MDKLVPQYSLHGFLFLLVISRFAVFADEPLLVVEIYDSFTAKRLNYPNALNRRYVWKHRTQTFVALIAFNVEHYNRYNLPPRNDLAKLVEQGAEDIDELIQKLGEMARNMPGGTEEKVNFIMAFVQSHPYAYDKPTTGFDDFPRYPLETLADTETDCEDTSILATAILWHLGYEVVLLNPLGHMAVGVLADFDSFYPSIRDPSTGKSYYYGETTGTGWPIGAIPDSYQAVEMNFIHIKEGERPILPSPTPAPAPVPQPVRPDGKRESTGAPVALFMLGLLASIAGLIFGIHYFRGERRNERVAPPEPEPSSPDKEIWDIDDQLPAKGDEGYDILRS